MNPTVSAEKEAAMADEVKEEPAAAGGPKMDIEAWIEREFFGRGVALPYPASSLSGAPFMSVREAKDCCRRLGSLFAPRAEVRSSPVCDDCRRPYGEAHGFPDLIIPFWAWKEISPTGDDGGLLCPSCICKRLHDRGITCEGAFVSGPIRSVDSVTMQTLRRVENIELAISGRDNRWSGIQTLVAGTGKQ